MVYRGTLIYAGKYTAERAEAALSNGWADLIGFFGGAATGYTDYPFAMQNGQALENEEKAR